MIRCLADTSVWIDYFNSKNNSPQKQKLKNYIESGEQVFFCPVIYQEVLQGVRNDDDFKKIKNFIGGFDMTKTDIITASNYAVDIYRALRKNGLTIRKPQDCLIAAYSIIEDLPLLHSDKDFDVISTMFELKIM